MGTGISVICVIAIMALALSQLYKSSKKENNICKEEPVEKPKEEPGMPFKVGEKVKVYQGCGWNLREQGKLLDGKILARKKTYNPTTGEHSREYVVRCGKYVILVSEEDVFPVEEG